MVMFLFKVLEERVRERVPFSEERGRNENHFFQKERGRNEMAISEERKKERIRSFSRSFPHKFNKEFTK